MNNLPTGPRPTGTVTFVFTDIEGSTRRWEANRAAMQLAFARQEAILRQTIQANGGYPYKMIGDAFQAAFPTAPQALQAAIDAQRALHSEKWPTETGEVRVRMALHTGTTEEREDDYVGPALNRVARLLSAGHGAQILLSAVTHELVQDVLPPGVQLLDLGEHSLKDLQRPEHVFQVVAPGLPSQFPPLKTLDSRPNNLPLQPTPLIGREKELAEVEKLLGREEVRLVTLVGPGGSGKTRLGLQVASDLLDDFPDGAWFVDLATLREQRLVVLTIAAVLGMKEEGSTPLIDTLKEYLKDKHLLLVLDNFEQVVEAAAQVSQLLASCPRLKVLVTSREPLRIRGEKEYPVPPLSVPDAHHLPLLQQLTWFEAVRLFIDRAIDVKPDFQLTNENAQAVAQICMQLDGLPLAIELAAARVRMLSPQALLARLSQRLSLRVLTGGARDLPARQQTLRNTIEWSYDLLGEGEKQLFTRMAPFSGGTSLQALQAVCNYDGQLQIDVSEGAESLLSHNLVREAEESGEEGEPRFRMLGTIHEYAREKLEESGEAEALQKEHALYFMRLAEEAERELTGKHQAEWYDRLEEEHDNIRAALRWAREALEAGRGEGENRDIALRIAGAMGRFWQTRGYYSEGREQLEALLSTFPAPPPPTGAEARATVGGNEHLASGSAARAKALIAAGMLAYKQGDYSAVRSATEEALATATALGDKVSMALCRNQLGNAALDQGDYSLATTQYEQSLALYRELEDKRGIGSSLTNLGLAALSQGDYALARSYYEQSLALQRQVGDKAGIAWSLTHLGTMAHVQGDFATARSLYEEGLALRRELGDKSGTGWSLGNLGNVAFSQGDYPAAWSLHQQSLALLREVGDKPGIAARLAALGAAAAGLGMAATGARTSDAGELKHAKQGARLIGAAERLLAAAGVVLGPEDRIPYEQGTVLARAMLGDEVFRKTKAEGQAMSMEQAIAYALQGAEDD